ncbi:MAG: alkane 1-monooxygenase [Alphaproteobacteria bacterium]|nr:alkane 1-monooxygenase [Alphaproteobacteria bacterium]
MRPLVFLTPLALFVPAFLATTVGGAWTWTMPLLTFGLVPVLDQLDAGSTANLDAEAEAEALADPRYAALLWAVVPLQLALLATFAWRLGTVAMPAWELAGTVATMGIACGVYGINVAHELGHRRHPGEQLLAKVLLATSLYVHFFVEHNRGHHRRVATPEDPASARRGESVYAFWARAVPGSWRSAWALESTRLERLGLPWWSWQNELVRLLAGQAVLVAIVGLIGGPVALAGFAVAATLGFLLLETVNYVEHYGLVRQRTDRGAYERVRPHHSWNSERPAGRVLLHELTRHADHHAHSTRPYQVLRHHAEAPQLPAGYPAMVLLALVPPLFRAVMEPELTAWEERFGTQTQAA